MKITRIGHSGILLQTRQLAMVVDWYEDETRCLEPIFEADLPVVFLVSHIHQDHWNPAVFTHPCRAPRFWILEAEVYDAIRARETPLNPDWLDWSAITRVSPGSSGVPSELNWLGVSHLWVGPSTDRGVSFAVDLSEDGHQTIRRIFHAGDLNDWDWQDEDSPAMHRAYDEALIKWRQMLSAAPIPTGAGGREGRESRLNGGVFNRPQIDLACLPVDARLGSRRLAGADHFQQYFAVKTVLPIHLFGDPLGAQALQAHWRETGVDTQVLVLEDGQASPF